MSHSQLTTVSLFFIFLEFHNEERFADPSSLFLQLLTQSCFTFTIPFQSSGRRSRNDHGWPSTGSLLRYSVSWCPEHDPPESVNSGPCASKSQDLVQGVEVPLVPRDVQLMHLPTHSGGQVGSNSRAMRGRKYPPVILYLISHSPGTQKLHCMPASVLLNRTAEHSPLALVDQSFFSL